MRDKNKSLIDTAAEFAESVLPEVQSALASALSSTQAGAASVSESVSEAAAASTEKIRSTVGRSKSHRGRNLLSVLVIGGVIAIAAVVIQRILSGRGEDAGDNWTSAYTPTPPAADVEDDPSAYTPTPPAADVEDDPSAETETETPST